MPYDLILNSQLSTLNSQLSILNSQFSTKKKSQPKAVKTAPDWEKYCIKPYEKLVEVVCPTVVFL